MRKPWEDAKWGKWTFVSEINAEWRLKIENGSDWI